MSVKPEKSWQYIALTRDGVSPEEAIKIVEASQRRVNIESAINCAIFDQEYDAWAKLKVGLTTKLFDPRNN